MNDLTQPVKRSLSVYRHLPEQDRWQLYSEAKRQREALEREGIAQLEPYDQFVRRVIDELEI